MVIDRITNTNDQQSRLFEAIELATKQANGLVKIESVDTNEHITLSEQFASDDYQFTITELTPRLFSFNSPYRRLSNVQWIG